MPRLASLASLAVPMVLAATSACHSDPCENETLSCSGGITINAHLQTTETTLLGSNATLCVEGSCATLSFSGGSGPHPYFRDAGEGWVVVPDLDDYGAGYPGNGQTYSVKIVAADGSVLLDVTRTALQPVTGHEDQCLTCTDSEVYDLYPSSISNIACPGHEGLSSVALQGDFGGLSLDTMDDSHHTLRVCLNSLCGTADLYDPYGAADGGFAATSSADLYLGGSAADRSSAGLAHGLYGGLVYVDTYTPTGFVGGTWNVTFTADAEDFADGDRWTVQLDDGAVYQREATVRYDESYPDGQPCDAMPVRMAAVTL